MLIDRGSIFTALRVVFGGSLGLLVSACVHGWVGVCERERAGRLFSAEPLCVGAFGGRWRQGGTVGLVVYCGFVSVFVCAWYFCLVMCVLLLDVYLFVG